MEHEENYITKNLFVLIISSLTALIALVTIWSFASLNDKINEINSSENIQAVTVYKEIEVTNEEMPIYVIKEFDNKIGVFKDGDFQYYIDVYVSTLTEQDKNLLRQGIEASSEQEVNEILSCYY